MQTLQPVALVQIPQHAAPRARQRLLSPAALALALATATSPPDPPLPSPPPAGSKVTAGTVNCDGSITVKAELAGKETAIADIVRLVEQAQARTAPIQRLADTVSGKFAYGVMALSAATLTFWSTVGTRLFPQVSCWWRGPAAADSAVPCVACSRCCCAQCH